MKKKRRTIYVGESSYPSPELVALLAADALPPVGRALETGCGIASDALCLAADGWQAHAVDADAKQVAAARRRASSLALPLDVRVARATALPFPDASFALVVDRLLWNNVLDDGDLEGYVDELARVVAPDGVVLVRAKSPSWRTVREAFASARPDELAPGRAQTRLGRAFVLAGRPRRLMLVDPFGGLVPAVVALLRRRPDGRARGRRGP